MRNSICMLSFPITHIVFWKIMCVLLINLGVCFFTKHVHVLVKDFKTSISSVFTFQDFDIFYLHISRLQCLRSLHFKTSMSSVFTFQDFIVFCLYISRFQCLLSLHFKTSMSSVFTFQDFNVFCLYILRLQCLLSLHFKTTMSFVFTFPKTSMCPILLCKTTTSFV